VLEDDKPMTSTTRPFRFAFCLAILAAVAMSAASRDQTPTLPDTPAGQQAAALLAALRDGTPAALQSFVAAHFSAHALSERPAEDRAHGMQRVAEDLGAGTLVRVDASKPNALTIVARSASGGLWLEFALEVEPEAPHGISGLRVSADSQPPAETSSAPVNERDAMSQIAAETQKRADADTFAGVVLVARNGEVKLVRSVGLADRESKTPVTENTRFNLGSINKIFTEVMIRQLAAQGKLKLDATLKDVLPDYPNPEVARTVTIQQILDHRSGLGDIFGDRFASTAKDHLRTLAEYLQLFADQPLLFAPGSEERYSNAGFVVLGLIIERLTGETYADALEHRVFQPAGMTESGLFAQDQIVPARAHGYTRRGNPSGPLLHNDFTLPGRGSSAGGGYATAGDLLRFTRALSGGHLLPLSAWPKGGGLGIAGGSPGCNAAVEDDGRSGWTIVVLSNLDPPSAEQLAREARSILRRVEDAGPPK
jgi:D-alanyl-D-alanine carboxypeptidase